MKRFRGRIAQDDEGTATGAETPRLRQESAPEPRVLDDPRVTTSTYIDEGCELSGNLRFSEPVKIDGRIEGDVVCRKTMIIGEPASVHSSVTCESIVVFGELDGDVEAQQMVTIHKTARVTAQIKTEGIVIEQGARFKGLIQVGRDEDRSASSADPGAAAVAPNSEKPSPSSSSGPREPEGSSATTKS